MEMSWPLVFQLIVLAFGLTMIIPVLIYTANRARDRAAVAHDRDQGVIRGQLALTPSKPRSSDDDD